MQDETVKFYLVFPDFKPGTVQILVTEEESDVILVKLNRIIKSVDDLVLQDDKYLCYFEFLIDLSSHNVKFIKVVAIVTTTEHFDKEGWILSDQSYLRSLLYGLNLDDIGSPLDTSVKQSHTSISQSWPLKCPLSLSLVACTEPSKPLFSLVMEAEEEVVIEYIDINVMNGIVGDFQEGQIVLKPRIKYHWSFGISFLDSCTKLIANFSKNSRESQHVLKTNAAVLNIQIHLSITGIHLISTSKAVLDFYNLYNTTEPIKTLEILHGKNVTSEVMKEEVVAPVYINTRQIFSIQVYIVNTSSKERNFILKIPNSDSNIVCLEDSIRIKLYAHKSFFLNLHFVSLSPCNAWIKRFELYDTDLDGWIDLVNVYKVIMTDLFGGAITADIPSSFIDASDFRPIPSHQEVYVSKDSYDSIIIEIMEMQAVPVESMAQYHLTEVCDSLANIVIEHGIKNQIGAIGSLGSGSINDQMIHMIVLRLEEKSTDLLISWNSNHSRSNQIKDLASSLIVRDFSLFS